MRRLCVPGLLLALAAAPCTAYAGEEKLDLFDGRGLGIQAEIQLNGIVLPPEENPDDTPAVEVGDEIMELAIDPFLNPEAGNSGDTPDPARKLTEEELKAVAEFTRKAAELRKAKLEKDFNQAASELADEVKLDAAAKAKLKALGPKVVAASLTSWESACSDYAKNWLSRSGATLANLKNWKPASFANGNAISGDTPMDETAEWKQALKEVLTAEQWKLHDDAVNARLAKLRADMADYLNACEAHASGQLTQMIESELRRLEQFGDLDEDRRKQFKTAADQAVKTATAAWKRHAERKLLDLSERQRENMTRGGGVMGVDISETSTLPKEQPAWKDAVEKHLSAPERKLIEIRQNEVRTRRASALAMMLVAELDRLLGLSEEQRGSLHKLATRPMLKLPDHYFQPPEGHGYYSLDGGQMLRQLRDVNEADLKPIFDEGQMKRWKAVTPDQLSRSGYVRERYDTGKLPAPEDMDEIEVERILSGFLHREARRMKLKMQSLMEAQLANIVRVSQPDAAAVATLRTASKGAAEEMALSSISSLTQWVRSQFQSVKPADVPARLQNLYNPYFSERQTAPEPAIWSATVERVLSEPQRAAWKTETAAREAWRLRGLCALVVTETEKRLPLKPAQREALEKRIDGVLKDYEPDFSRFFSTGWHLQGYYSMIPMAMLSEKELAEIFSKEEIETVKEKCLANAAQYTDMIRQQHKSRMRSK